MTEHTNDRENPSKTPSRPEGQDTSETMDNKTKDDIDTTAVLPSAEAPPTQEIAQATQQVPEGPASEGPASEESAPEGEVHPAYGAAAARVQAEAEPAATTVQDAPASNPQTGSTQETRPARPAPSTQPAQPAQPAAQAAAKRGPRVGTTVWGLIVIAVGLGILAVSAGVMFDLGVALIVLLGAAGVILVVGSVVSSIRRR